METYFWDFVRDFKRFELNIGDVGTADKSGKTLFLHLERLKKTDRIVYENFVDLNYDLLVKLKFSMSTYPNLRSLHDKLFTKTLEFPKKTVKGITRIFGKFIEGITFFSHQQSGVLDIPVYHRLSSCGTGDKAFRTKYNQCTSTTSKYAKRKIKKQIQTCFLERLIYAELFKHQTLFFPTSADQTLSQDDGHENWLKQTFDDFRTCFPDTNISVEIIEYYQQWPIHLRITVAGKQKVVYEYIKNVLVSSTGIQYERFVKCKLLLPNGTRKAKVQDFKKETRWEEIKH